MLLVERGPGKRPIAPFHGLRVFRTEGATVLGWLERLQATEGFRIGTFAEIAIRLQGSACRLLVNFLVQSLKSGWCEVETPFKSHC